MKLTVGQAARVYARHPGTLRRWIREGGLSATKVSVAYLDEADPPQSLPLPTPLRTLPSGAPMFDAVKALHEIRRGR